MFKSYLKTSLRFLLKNKTFSFINIIGLSVGTLCCLYILFYVHDQYSYDKHHQQAGSIYRVTTDLVITGDKHKSATSSPPIAPALKQDFPEVEQYTRVSPTLGIAKSELRYQDKSFYESNVFYVDSTFFNVFTYHFVNGNATKVLAEPYSVVLLKPVADKLFGSADPVGKVITINNADSKHDFKVAGVVDESLGKTHLKASLFVTMRSGSLGDYILQSNSWAGNNFLLSYIKLKPGTNVASFEKRLPAFLNRHGAQQIKELGMKKQLHLQPIANIHTTTGYSTEPSETVGASFLYTLTLIAILIQVIACINFMNLSTARASNRAREVGVRKVIGARKSDLIKQFLGESLLLSFIGVLIALPLLMLALPYLNQITHSTITLSLLHSYSLWLALIGLIAITGLVAGSYPAFYLAAFRAIKVMKGNFTNHVSAASLRRSLVIFQFVLSIVLITGIIVIYTQLNYIKSKDLGFDKAQKLVFNFYTQSAQSQMQIIANDLRQLTEVKAVAKADNYPSQPIMRDHQVFLSGGNMATAVDVQNMTTDENFLKAVGVKLLNGHNFRLSDSGKVLINETLLKRLRLKPETAIGTRLYTQYLPDPLTYVEIAGVIKDFNYNSLHTEVKPFMLIYNPKANYLLNLIVATQSNKYQALLEKIAALWHKDLPGVPFEYTFLNDEVQKQYETEVTLSRIINCFTIMAILISCLGLFGLAAFSAEQRNKEIGIRKVLGASIAGIVQLLSVDFLKLVLVALLIAIPVAWWCMSQWLQSFAYRTSISWWMFALSGLIAMVIALGTIGFQAVKAAVLNPVKSLRSE
ncbi:FtsX-like permease family protein [Mucilaginibacter robiniae]|uniref:FtsX-like permease family protein n=1 Tax=Mucilaginibacter robiniae TaxID=2728022 RepID=A0A7L5E1T0_9SPHI|nr:ABC transporter permease [Mucilaginibacter robiniae]QJD97125.1 FtsX-like permease family protein [Mucilaginibacter robiniae]